MLDQLRGSGKEATLALVALFGAGSLVGLPTIVLDPWATANTPAIAFNCASAAISSVLLYVFRRRVDEIVRLAGVFVGATNVGVALYLGGGGTATALYAQLLLWITIYAGVFLAPRAAAAVTVYAACCAAIALGLVSSVDAAVTIWLTTLLTAGAATAVVTMLTSRVRALASRDPLTGLANRRALEDHIERLEARREVRSVGIIALDLDGFKAVNDSKGHAAGDTLLCDVATCWSSLLRGEDFIARTGGDEFVVVLDGCDVMSARDVAERLQRATPRPVTASLGLAIWDGTGSLPAQLARADSAMYESKAAHRASAGTTRGHLTAI